MGIIEDVLVELETYSAWNEPDADEVTDADEMTDDDLLDWAAENSLDWAVEDFASLPVHNPLRDVGRNDPCPCGGGRKFKKCCLRQA